MKRSLLAAAALTGLAMATPAAPLLAQDTATAAATSPASVAQRYELADRYLYDGMRDLVVDAGMNAQFVHDSQGIVFRKGPAGQRQILYLDIARKQARPIIAEARLAALLAQAADKELKPHELSLRDADFDPATGELSFNAFDKRWTLDGAGILTESDTGQPGGEGSLSPDGRFRVVARDFNLIAIDTASGREVPLTTDGTVEQPYGRDIPMLPEILAQGTEQPDMPVSVRWSPDSTKILTWRLDTRGVKKLSVTQENPPGEFYPRSFDYIYPLAGAKKLPQATRYIVNVEQALKKHKAKLVKADVPSESLLYPAAPDMGWYKDNTARMQWTERGYGQLVVYRVDPATGASRKVAVEAMKPLVTVTSSFIWPAEQLHGELDVSERSGWAQLYLVRPDDPAGGYPLTRGDWEVTGIEHVAEDGHSILLTGVGREYDRNPYWTQLYRVNLDGSQPVLLTPEPLNHDVKVSSDGRYAIDAMSSPTVPTRTVLRDTQTGAILFELGHADASKLMASGFTPPEPFKGVAADGKTPLYGMIYRPADFDPTKTYPVIDHVYTGPTTTQVPASWGRAIFSASSSVAQLGAIVVMIDGRGTSHRGQKFRLPAYQNLGEVGLDDHIGMIRQMAKRYPYMDTDRVGVFGGSAGGYDAARFILRRPDFFKVSIASSGNHDLRLDKAWWPEVSMGNAPENVWEANSNMSVAANLKGKLLLIHGDIDDNVPVTESYRLAHALIEAKRDVDLVILPNTRHAVYQPFFWRKFRDYFTRNLIGDTPPGLDADNPPLGDETSPLQTPENPQKTPATSPESPAQDEK
ncbi:S9 family peptidase [Altericroceibacterium spongiae]|uniref:S9 family peptidase n=1 Tax=Altericroceibacterium spongiae TaxID=2320269 RepID=A0A420EE73_9SPHN|nr:DPP IV N-terminal domain-containing protein [Altericroceibacterium spongiae]RKF18975.1 S9 family peptidase [Altericroceibacterium spongiae]